MGEAIHIHRLPIFAIGADRKAERLPYCLPLTQIALGCPRKTASNGDNPLWL